MAREQSEKPAIEVFLLSAGALDPADPGVEALLSRLREQVAVRPEPAVIDLTDPAGAQSRLVSALAPKPGAVTGPVALLDAHIVVNAPPLGAVLDDPRVRTGALAVREAGRQVQLGVLKVDAADRAVAAQLAAGLPAARPAALILALTEALTAAGVDVKPVPLGGYAWARTDPRNPSVPENLSGQSNPSGPIGVVSSVDERNVRLREAARGGDGFYSTFVLRRLSWRLTGLAERTGLTPNQVTLISFAIGLIAAGFLAVGGRGWSVAGAVLLQVCLVVDCVDGELARYRRRFSRFGAWLDATTDRVKEFAAVAALALAAARSGDGNLWWLVAAAIGVQTFRNLLDLGWSLQRSADAPVAPAELWAAAPDGIRWPAAPPAGPGAGSWARRVGHFPIGERFLLISLGAAFWSSKGTLAALLVAGLLSAGYMIAAFAVRSRTSAASGARIAGLADAGPLLGAAIRRISGARAGRLTVLLPALVAVGELALIWWFALPARDSAAVALIAVTAIAHYQHAYGVREDGVEIQTLVIGTDLRLLLLGLLVVLPAALNAGSSAATVAVWVLAGVVALSSTERSLRAWTAGSDDSAPNEPEHVGMESVTVDTPPAMLRQAIGGVR
jgi:phosphatidylglycerophosphate synthase